jgi:hypothetical protein
MGALQLAYTAAQSDYGYDYYSTRLGSREDILLALAKPGQCMVHVYGLLDLRLMSKRSIESTLRNSPTKSMRRIL